MKIRLGLFPPILIIGMASCGPTTDTVKAPFELSSDFTSSTSGSSPVPGLAKAHQRLEQFVAYAYSGVSCDIAQGHGEYLASLQTLAGIPIEERSAFGKDMQSRYGVLSNPQLSHEEARSLVVNHAWSAGYGKTEQMKDSSATKGL